MAARLPHNLRREHILQSMDGIDSGRVVVPPNRQSRKFVVRHNAKQYPPKFLICKANELLTGTEWRYDSFGGGSEANNFLIARKFEVWDVSKRPPLRLGLQAEVEEDESAFPEGRALYRVHRSRERDTKLAQTAKDRALAAHGELVCQVCGFSFEKKYGSVGAGFIECHHTIAVSELRGHRKTKIEELALVCSNCHRMLHRYRPWPSLDVLKRGLDPTDV